MPDAATLVEPERARRVGRIYLTGLAVSLIGSSAMTLVAGVWVKSLTGSSSAAGLVSVCVYAPALIGPVLGVLVDRVRLRTSLLAANLAGVAAMTSLLAVRGSSEVWLIYVVMAAYGLLAVVVDPAESALFAALFDDATRSRLNGVRLSLQEGGKLVAPLAGAGLFTVLGGGAVAALDALSFAVAGAAVLAMRVDPPVSARTEADWRQTVTAGARQLWRDPELREVVALATAAMATSGLLVAAQFDLVAGLHRAPGFLGVLTALLGAGSVVAGLLSGRLVRRIGERRLALLGVADLAVGWLLRTSGLLPVVLVGSVVLGFALPWVVVAAIGLTQRRTPQALQGRVASTLSFLLFAPLPVTQVAGSALSAGFDYRALYGGATLLVLVVAALTVMAMRRIRSRSARDAPTG